MDKTFADSPMIHQTTVVGFYLDNDHRIRLFHQIIPSRKETDQNALGACNRHEEQASKCQ